jgi:predicted metal-dependent peptidase
MAKRKAKAPSDPNAEAFQAAWAALRGHPMFSSMSYGQAPNGRRSSVAAELLEAPALAAQKAIARVGQGGSIQAAKAHRFDVAEWTWVLSHCLLHLGFGHLAADGPYDEAGRAAACVAVARFQRAVKLGREPLHVPAELPTPDEEVLARQWRERGVPDAYRRCGVGGDGPDLIIAPGRAAADIADWPAAFAVGLAAAATAAIDVAGGVRTSLTDAVPRKSIWDQAKRWFISSFPLLGGLASGFEVVSDADLARSWDISVAAVSAAAGEIYINPLAGLGLEQWKFVFAHEMLHAALRHGDRAGARDAYLWNVACDYVINGWLVEMQVGEMPDGLLFDTTLHGLSAEAVYDRIVTDVRRMRKLATLRGKGLGDVLGEPLPWTGRAGHGVDLDDFYRRALLTGYAYHTNDGRGLLPAGLVEEIRVLEHPPLPWDARLARWFDEFVPSPQRSRSYARPSRRQAGTPDIPRPGWRYPDELVERCTFGVVLDTSGSMDHRLLGKALGAIASYAAARDVPAARVVCCDAAAYDLGFVAVDDIAGRVRVRGRGGTVLQPGIDLLERAPDFPPSAPILVITDAACDVVRIRREHAYLVPEHARLPFTPRGPVFPVR